MKLLGDFVVDRLDMNVMWVVTGFAEYAAVKSRKLRQISENKTQNYDE